ncbi:hypothetical protein FQN60_007657 [Etheostoma spectabile]|uniref:Valine--tRNA ligase, mitochondrial n=1 Tax=Etheostoma spectabile TaxID=54343 RepID=A0A5J5CUF3_9PERO|nr:hypothetical protein FQN60_007657 [Etheostoma spectabile]
MWRSGRALSCRLPGEGAARLCFGIPHRPSSSSQSNSSPRTKAEKLRRRREREEAILSNTSSPLPSSYSPEYVESSWYQWWEKEGFFRPEQHERLSHSVDQTFSLCIPPPNVTGTLHLGHALTVAVEDVLVRRYLPTTCAVGLFKKTVVERRLLKERGKHRQDFTRQEFLHEVWKWKNERGEEIYQQLRALGASLDWSRACFTMDPGFSRAVTEAFVRLCDSGLIYRSEALVNWSCALESAISDIEVDSKELSGQTMLSVPGYENKVEFGTMLTFAYPIEGHDGEVAVSTTPAPLLQLFSMSGGQAVHGKQCRHPFTNRLLPIIADSMVDMELGTGAVKVTPAHDHTDFLLSQRHSLPHLTVIGGDGTMTPSCGQWLQVHEHLYPVGPVLSDRGSRFDVSSSLLVSFRSGDIIEPLLKKQWFLRCDEMAKKAIQAVEDGQLEIIPHHYTKTWKNWLSNTSDWCISRQLWWGHQIPAYRVELPNSADKQENTNYYNPDVLDTWFSSGLFPFAMLGWPEQLDFPQTTDLQRFYPNSILETGSDLIFFWVARMVMLGTELTGKLPFRQVLLHSLVRDKYGRKMSKSLGNVIDPLDVIHGVSLERLQEKVKEGNLDPREQLVAMEAQRKDFPTGIPQCGTDALRFALCSHKMQGEDISLSISQVLSCRYFCNKMWQALRFTLGVLGANTTPVATLEETCAVSSMERWICSRLYSTVVQCEQAFEAYELHTVTSALYSFWVHSLCDVYMAHWHFPEEERDFLLVQEVIRVARSLRSHCGMTKEKPAMWAVCSPGQAQILLHFGSAVRTLGRISSLHIHCPQRADLFSVHSTPPPEGSLIGVVDHTCQLHLHIQSGMNIENQMAQLSQRRDKLVPKLEKILCRVQSPDYLTKVPAHVRQQMDTKVSSTGP